MPDSSEANIATADALTNQHAIAAAIEEIVLWQGQLAHPKHITTP